MIPVPTAVLTGAVFPEALVHSEVFGVLAAFVALNTVMYGALAVAKMLPRVHPPEWFGDRNRRSQNRSIHPDPPSDAR